MKKALVILALLSALVGAAPAYAQSALPDCSQTVGTTAAPVVFAKPPSVFVEICNAHASQTLGVNWVGGAAAIGAQGTLTLATGTCRSWSLPLALPKSISVIGSGSGTTTACGYR